MRPTWAERDLWSARCSETGTPGAGSGPGNGPVDKTGTAPRADFTTHVSAAMAELIAARPWLTVYRLPPYAHELNPVEPVRSHLKRSLANLTKHTILELS
jgi:transposase